MPCILKFIALDLHLTIEGYHLQEIEGQQKKLAACRAESAKLYQKVATDQLTGVMSFNHVMEVLENNVNKAAQTGRRCAS
jgi:two-component system, cell cycle response regulator